MNRFATLLLGHTRSFGWTRSYGSPKTSSERYAHRDRVADRASRLAWIERRDSGDEVGFWEWLSVSLSEMARIPPK